MVSILRSSPVLLAQALVTLAALRKEWPACSYHITRRNCVTFAEEFARALQAGAFRRGRQQHGKTGSVWSFGICSAGLCVGNASAVRHNSACMCDTTARFINEIVQCADSADLTRSTCRCAISSATFASVWAYDRLYCSAFAEPGTAASLRLIMRGAVALRAGVEIDAYLHAFSSLRAGSREPASALIDARCKEAQMHHRHVRKVPYGAPGFV